MKKQRRHIDWAEVHGRLQASQQALEQALTADATRVEAAYRARATQLGSRRAWTETATTLRVLVFALGDDSYGLDLDDLAEIVPFVGCVPVPAAPPALLGVMNCHGAIRSIIDLRRLLGSTEPASKAGGYVLLLRQRDRAVGARVDQIDRIRHLTPDELTRPADANGGPALQFVRGLTADRMRLLSTEAIFAHPLLQPETT